MRAIKRFLGVIIILVSALLYARTFVLFILMAVGGWTSDYSQQPLLEHLLARLMAGLLFLSNISLSLSGVQIFRDKIRRITYLLLIFGLISVIVLSRI